MASDVTAEAALTAKPPTDRTALDLRGITKRYGDVVACDDVALSVRHGEIHGLLGENGAGKSTLMKVLLGLVPRDSGSIALDGRPVHIDSPQRAVALGLGMVHQHFSLVEPLTVWENVVLGDTGRVDRALACHEIEEVGRRYGLPIDPAARVDRLSAGERQRVELVKCLRRDPTVLILDEPTSVLTRAESAELFEVLRRVVRAENRSVILISHKLAEITAATDRVTVLRRGRVAFRATTADTTHQELARQMVGRAVSLTGEAAALGLLPDAEPLGVARPEGSHAAQTGTAPALALRDITVTVRGTTGLDALSLEVAPGEILAVYGVEGNGQAVLGDLLSGLVAPERGSVTVTGTDVAPARPGALRRAGLGIIPEDRHSSGVVLDMSVAQNLVLTSLESVSGRFLVSRRRMRERAAQLAEEYGVLAPSLDAPLRSLSGGNQQRVVLARELSAKPKVLVAAQPTHGLDVGAIEDMYRRLRQAADQGLAVLLITTELEEAVALSARIAVLSRGRVTGVLPTAEATAERLGLLLGGVTA